MRCIVLGLYAQLWVKAKNCTVSRIKHTYLALNVEVGPSILGQDQGRSPLEREVASVGGIGGFKELLTFLRVEEEEEPCWARETKFTLSCSFKTTAGQGERVDALQFGPGARTEERRA